MIVAFNPTEKLYAVWAPQYGIVFETPSKIKAFQVCSWLNGGAEPKWATQIGGGIC